MEKMINVKFERNGMAWGLAYKAGDSGQIRKSKLDELQKIEKDLRIKIVTVEKVKTEDSKKYEKPKDKLNN